MIETHEKKFNMKYDVVVRLRPDTMFFVPMPEISLQTTKICTLDIREYGAGGEDIFNVGRRDEMILFMKRIYGGQKIFESIRHSNFIDSSWTQHRDGIGSGGSGAQWPGYNAELYVRYWWFNKCSSHNGELEYQHSSSRNGPELGRGDLREHQDDWFFHVYHFNQKL